MSRIVRKLVSVLLVLGLLIPQGVFGAVVSGQNFNKGAYIFTEKNGVREYYVPGQSKPVFETNIKNAPNALEKAQELEPSPKTKNIKKSQMKASAEKNREMKQNNLKNNQAGADRINGKIASKNKTLNAPGYAADEVIVKYKSGTAKNTVNSINSKYFAAKGKSLKLINADVMKLQKGKNVEDVVKALKADKNVEFAEPNYRVQASDITSEPLSGQLWGLENYGQPIFGNPGTEDVDIDITDAWNNTMGNDQVIVAVIDTGVDINHPELNGRIWSNPGEIAGNGMDDDGNGYIDDVNGWDFFNSDDTVFDPEQGDDHGTHVSGTIAADLNTIGVVGVAPNVKIMPLKFLGPQGGYDSDAVLAIDYAKSHGVKIINTSWGGGGHSEALRQAILNSGSLFVAAAGNDSNNTDVTPYYPASYDCDNIISTAAVDNNGNLGWFSNYGLQTVDVAAPGVDILSTVPRKPAQGAAIMSSTGVYKTLFQGFGLEIVDTPQERQDIMSGALGFFGVNSLDKILLVQDDGSDSVQNTDVLSYYQDSLTALGYSDITNHKVALGQNGPDQSTLSQYKLVVWFTGDTVNSDSQGPNIMGTDQDNLKNYLNGGGNLYLAGRDAGWAIENTDFYINYLHTKFLYEDNYRQSIYGNDGTVFDGKTYNLIPSIWMDYLMPSDSTGSTALTYTPEMDYSNAYAYFSGTSMAAPHVSGIAALIAGSDVNDPLAIKNDIIAGSEPLASLNGLVGVGAMVNANNALSTEPDDDIPGVPLKDSNTSTADQDLDLDDVYNIFLQAGESVKFTLSGDPGTDFDLYLYAPWATTVKNTEGMIRYSENEGSSEQIEYVAEETGTYYVDVYAYSGSGEYTLNFERGQRIFDDRNPELNYTGNWQDLNSELHEYGTAKTLNSAGGVTCQFTGHDVKWTGFKDNKQGIAKVYIDGTLAGQVDLYSSTPKYKQLLFEKEIDYGYHEMTIQWAGLWDKAAKKTSTAINVDTILVQTSMPKPPAPANLNAMGFTNGIVLLFDPVPLIHVTGYNIYRSLDGVSYDQINFIPQEDLSYSQIFYWDSVYEDRDYFYKVTALNSNGIQSDPSDVVVARPVIPNSIYTLEDTSNHVSYSGEWTTENDPAYSSGTSHATLQAGAKVEIPVTGYETSVTLMMGPDMGTARVYYPGMSGTFWQDFDLYSENPDWWRIGETQPFRMVGDHFTVECISGKISFDYAIVYDVDTDNPEAPSGLGGSISADTVTLNWTDSIDADVTGFDVYRSTPGSGWQKLNLELLTDLSYTDNNVAVGNEYHYSVTAVSYAGLVSMNSAEFIVDRNPPAPPAGLSLTRNGSGVDLNWAANAEPDLAGYIVYRSTTAGSGYTAVNTSLITGTSSYTDSSIAAGIDYYYVIRAVDTSGNQSQDSNEVKLDQAPPAAPMNLSGISNGSSVNLIWAANTETDLAGYNVYRSTTAGSGYTMINPGLISSTSYTDSTLVNGNTYYYVVRAVDTSGNVSAASNEVQILPPPTGGTTRVEENDPAISYTGIWSVHTLISDSGGAGKYSSTTGNFLTYTFNGIGVKWLTLANTARGIAKVTLDGVAENVDQYSATTQFQKVVYEKYNLTPGQHTIKIEVTGLKNASSTSKTIFIDAFDVINSIQLAAPSGLTLANNGSNSVLSWTANTESNVAGYNIYRSTIAGSGYAKINSDLVTGTSYIDSGIDPGIDYYYVIRAVDTSGNQSQDSNEVKLDQTPPAAPMNLSGISNGSSVNLIWTANTETDLAGYNVYRSMTAGSGYTMIDPGLITSTSYTDSTLVNGNTYYYVVMAVDASGNMSAASNEVQILPPPTGGTTRVEENDPAISYTGTWTVHTLTSDSGGAGKYSSTTGNFLTFTFSGIGIKWLTLANTGRGIAKVTLDGVAENVDLYSATSQYQKVVYEKYNLAPGQHTIKIEVTGLKNASSTSKTIFIDAFDVIN